MNPQNPTLEEQERAAYISGDTRTAELLARIAELEAELEEARELLEAIE